jgi:hypothetical protein
MSSRLSGGESAVIWRCCWRWIGGARSFSYLGSCSVIVIRCLGCVYPVSMVISLYNPHCQSPNESAFCSDNMSFGYTKLSQIVTCSQEYNIKCNIIFLWYYSVSPGPTFFDRSINHFCKPCQGGHPMSFVYLLLVA